MACLSDLHYFHWKVSLLKWRDHPESLVEGFMDRVRHRSADLKSREIYFCCEGNKVKLSLSRALWPCYRSVIGLQALSYPVLSKVG